jgi:hypothetical protein
MQVKGRSSVVRARRTNSPLTGPNTADPAFPINTGRFSDERCKLSLDGPLIISLNFEQ